MLAYWCYCILAPFFSPPHFPPSGRGCEGGGGFIVLWWGFFSFKFFSWNSLVTCEGKKIWKGNVCFEF